MGTGCLLIMDNKMCGCTSMVKDYLVQLGDDTNRALVFLTESACVDREIILITCIIIVMSCDLHV